MNNRYNIVLTPNFFKNVKKEEINLETKKMLDEMHRQKIDMSDEIAEIEYAKTKGKKICYLESVK